MNGPQAKRAALEGDCLVCYYQAAQDGLLTEHPEFSYPLLSDHHLFCNQSVELAELKRLGSCRDKTQLNKQILK